MADTCTICLKPIIRGEAFHWFGNEPYHLACLWIEYTRARKYLDTAVARGNRLETENQRLKEENERLKQDLRTYPKVRNGKPEECNFDNR